MPVLQDLLHKLEVGGGMRYFRVGFAVLGVVLLMASITCARTETWGRRKRWTRRNWPQYRPGQGLHDSVHPPFEHAPLKKRATQRAGALAADGVADPAQIRGMHPDISNPPVYPLVLAGLMKVCRFDYTIATTKPFWSNAGRFWRYKPDFAIALLNQFLFLAAIALVFFLARHLFDPAVAWLGPV